MQLDTTSPLHLHLILTCTSVVCLKILLLSDHTPSHSTSWCCCPLNKNRSSTSSSRLHHYIFFFLTCALLKQKRGQSVFLLTWHVDCRHICIYTCVHWVFSLGLKNVCLVSDYKWLVFNRYVLTCRHMWRLAFRSHVPTCGVKRTDVVCAAQMYFTSKDFNVFYSPRLYSVLVPGGCSSLD